MTRERPLTENIFTDRAPLNLKEYEQRGGYTAMRKALKELTPKEVQKMVQDSKLSGRGGAGFNTGMKWSFVPMDDNAPHPKYLIAMQTKWNPAHLKTGYYSKATHIS